KESLRFAMLFSWYSAWYRNWNRRMLYGRHRSGNNRLGWFRLDVYRHVEGERAKRLRVRCGCEFAASGPYVVRDARGSRVFLRLQVRHLAGKLRRSNVDGRNCKIHSYLLWLSSFRQAPETDLVHTRTICPLNL